MELVNTSKSIPNILDYICFFEKTLVDVSNKINYKQLEKLANTLVTSTGNIYFSGVGKNGMLAENISATFASIGLKSFFIDPTHAFHGDLGKIKDGDIIIGISKSGTTEELLNFIKQLKFKNVYKILITFGQINEHFDETIQIERVPELDKNNIIPTTSIIIFNIVLYSVVAYIVDIKDIDTKDFIKNHPGGYIGKYGNK